MLQPCLIYLISLIAGGTTKRCCNNKEMMQPCPLHLHVISLVRLVWWPSTPMSASRATRH